MKEEALHTPRKIEGDDIKQDVEDSEVRTANSMDVNFSTQEMINLDLEETANYTDENFINQHEI